MATIRHRPVVGFAIVSCGCLAGAAVGALMAVQRGRLNLALSNPGWVPPASMFGPVWLVLYLATVACVWPLARDKPEQALRHLLVFAALLATTAAWSWALIAGNSGAVAFADIALLGLLAAATPIALWQARPLAAALLLPLPAWIAFVAALHYLCGRPG